ncbi:hypothetical protein [Nocardia gipuzkoensis]
MITGPDGVVEVIVSSSEYQQLKKAREELRRLREERTRSAIAAQMREGVVQLKADPDAFRTLTREGLLRTDIFDRP